MYGNKERLLAVLLDYAPDKLAQQKVSDMFNMLCQGSMKEAEIEKCLIMNLSDGVLYGNWLWIPVR